MWRPRLAARGWTSRGRLPPRLFTRKRKVPRVRERMEAGTSSTSTVNSSENQVSAAVSSGDTGHVTNNLTEKIIECESDECLGRREGEGEGGEGRGQDLQ